ncbi:uncharacterized protein N7484_010154 [Penicillium longicatenatum]|uniref:uncharacterized protein n=1 Tax=Penicillium longicatenatum TaxID=1561947 RepID=UPI00254851EE|nr:uncharacterized protein N7484_010154 [Penicillium longicatenatum]KAJ5636841.1 hypothetical protein N7484_010154 [Penicillium longicatenatum]
MTLSQLEIFVRALSRLLGWIYMACWSTSFYPQPIYNFRRGSTAGTSIDFPTVNCLGFIYYTIYNGAFLFSPVIRAQYASRHPLSEEPTVRLNDFAFAVHAVIMSLVVYSQFWPMIWGLQVSRFQRISKPIAGLFWGSVLAPLIAIWVVLAKSPDGGHDPSTWAWIDVIYIFSYIKLVITVVKYVPQAWMNYKCQSTLGWNINQILLDLAGGVLSLLQLIMDSSLQSDWSGITGNPVKLFLGNITIISDLIFITQHYILYRGAESKPGYPHSDADSTAPLLAEESAQAR